MKDKERSKKMTSLKINGIGFDVNDDGSIDINNNHTIFDLRDKMINYLYQKDVNEYTELDLDLLKMLLIEK